MDEKIEGLEHSLNIIKESEVLNELGLFVSAGIVIFGFLTGAYLKKNLNKLEKENDYE